MLFNFFIPNRKISIDLSYYDTVEIFMKEGEGHFIAVGKSEIRA